MLRVVLAQQILAVIVANQDLGADPFARRYPISCRSQACQSHPQPRLRGRILASRTTPRQSIAFVDRQSASSNGCRSSDSSAAKKRLGRHAASGEQPSVRGKPTTRMVVAMIALIIGSEPAGGQRAEGRVERARRFGEEPASHREQVAAQASGRGWAQNWLTS
jgi:hypothetical protein